MPAGSKLIVIHGWGGTLAGAVREVRGLFDFDCRWRHGSFRVESRIGVLVRRLLETPEPDRYVRAFRDLVFSRFLSASARPAGGDAAADEGRYASFAERRLVEDFPEFAPPLLPAARERRAQGLKREAERVLAPILPILARVDAALSGPGGRLPDEAQARAVLFEHLAGADAPTDLVQLLESVRDMRETGGDLDTVAAAALYTHALRARAEARNGSFEYGRDYRYVFVNYHESLRPLADCGPGSLLIADLPIGAFPGFEGDVRFLLEKGIRVERFEDHHPCTPAQRDLLEGMAADGRIGFLDLSGPIEGREPGAAERRCAADLVYGNGIAGQEGDCEGARVLRDAAHAEDFVTARTPLGTLLTDLIKGGICKIELVQLLADAVPGNDALPRLQARGWDALAAAWSLDDEEIREGLLENAYTIDFRRPPGGEARQGAAAAGPGSDVPVAARHGDRPVVRVVTALAPGREPGQRRIAAGRAADFYRRHIPGADYLFYSYGAGLLVARRLNQADLSFNLGRIMRRIGCEHDGGHAGAAVCRPDQNPQFPGRLLGAVSSVNFGSFVHYLANALGAQGYEALAVRKRSPSDGLQFREGGRKLAIITLAAVAVGILLALLSPRFRPAAIRESNRDFFPQIAPEDAETEQTEYEEDL